MLGIGLDIARSGLTAAAERSALAARNIANASNPLASRKIANVVSGPGGGALVTSIVRDQNEALSRGYLEASAQSSAQSAISAALNKLDATVNDPNLESSPAARIGALGNALQTYSINPGNVTLARSAVEAARTAAASLNEASQTVQQTRQQADTDMAVSVGRINTLLSQFQTVNEEILGASRAGADLTDALDARDSIVRSLAEELSVRTLPQADNGMALYTDSGLTLFDTVPRTVSFTSSAALPAGSTGNAVFVDGVQITGPGATMGIRGGRLSGLAEVRDTLAPAYQSQLDDVARGLMTAFAESDQSALPTQPSIPGLFTWPGSPAIPAPGGATGLAAQIMLNPNADPAQGGNALRLRDGGIGAPGNPAYVYNTTGASAFPDRINGLIDALSTPLAFNADGLPASATVAGAAAASAGWLEDVRQGAASSAEYRETVMQRSLDALSRATGVNLDDEMSAMLDIERAYQTSSKILTMVDRMLSTLMEAV